MPFVFYCAEVFRFKKIKALYLVVYFIRAHAVCQCSRPKQCVESAGRPPAGQPSCGVCVYVLSCLQGKANGPSPSFQSLVPIRIL